MPEPVKELYGFLTSDGKTKYCDSDDILTNLNDKVGMTLADIADIIEKDLNGPRDYFV